jgi:hypothetical protein
MNVGAAILLLAVLVALALAIAVLMLLIFAQVIGWRELSRAFPAGAGPHIAGRFPFDGVVLGAWGWNAPPLRISLDNDGLWLLPRPPLGIAFRNIRLPWAAIFAVGPRQFMLFDVIELRYGEGSKDTISFLSGSAAAAVARYAAARGALPTPASK